MPLSLLAESFSKERVDPDYWLDVRVLGKNLLYVVAADGGELGLSPAGTATTLTRSVGFGPIGRA